MFRILRKFFQSTSKQTNKNKKTHYCYEGSEQKDKAKTFQLVSKHIFKWFLQLLLLQKGIILLIKITIITIFMIVVVVVVVVVVLIENSVLVHT